jgi:hypothetical protein
VSRERAEFYVRLGIYDVNLVGRKKDDDVESAADRLRMRGVVASEEEALDLTAVEYAVANAARATKEDAPRFRETVRSQRPPNRGLLLIYPVRVQQEAIRSGEEFIPALGISFPVSPTAMPLSYTVNDTWKEQYGLADEPEDSDQYS